MSEKNPSPTEVASSGGKARAQALTEEQRLAIAKQGAAARWDLVRSTHEGVLRIGDVDFDCAVLEDGTRVLTETSLMRGFGLYWSGYIAKRKREREKTEGAAVIPHFLSLESLAPYIGADLLERLSEPLKYRSTRGKVGRGIRAELIPKILEVWILAKDAGALVGRRQQLTAAKAQLLLTGLATVGIVALIDEATGYQSERARNALAQILEQWIAKELAAWAKTFPDEFYRLIYKLQGWAGPFGNQRTPLVGKLTKNIVYQRLAPGVAEELQRITPRDDNGRLQSHYHRRLTQNHGYQALKSHLEVVVALMMVSEDWKDFMGKLDRVKPRFGETSLLFR